MATYPATAPNRGVSQKKKPSFDHYDPNANRSPTYPNKWTLDTKIRTGRCRLCELKFAKCDYNIRCNNDGCGMHICQICWEGKQSTTAGEKLFEGEHMNEKGCWCRTSGIPPRDAQAMIDVRTTKIQAFVEAEQGAKRNAIAMEDGESEEDPTLVKKSKVVVVIDGDDDEDDGQLAMSAKLPSSPPSPKTPVRQVRRTQYGDFDADAEDLSAPLSSPRAPDSPDTSARDVPSLRPVKHLQNKTTVIIGAGVVGLSIARELAVHASESGTKHSIVVVEARGKVAQLASGSCAGLLTIGAVPSELARLADLSKEWWSELKDDADAAQEFGYVPNGIQYPDAMSASSQSSTPPSWFRARPSKPTSTNDNDMGKISSPSYIEWLYNQCLELDVDIYVNAQVSDFKKHGFDGRILSVDICGAEPAEDEIAETIKCQNIIVAAGPWTSGVVAGLLPWANFSLDNHLKRYEYIQLIRDDLTSDDDLGMVLEEKDGGVLFSARPSQRDIIAAAVIDKNENKPLSLSQALGGPTARDTNSIQHAAKRYLTSYDETDMVKARSWISTATASGLPIIDKIPAAKVDERFGGEEESPLGLWLCYGFGEFGTTLAPGAARALRRRICGEESGIGEAVCAKF